MGPPRPGPGRCVIDDLSRLGLSSLTGRDPPAPCQTSRALARRPSRRQGYAHDP